MHYVVSAVRLAYDDRPIVNTAPIAELAEPHGGAALWPRDAGRLRLTAAAWTVRARWSTRFEIARNIGSGASAPFTLRRDRTRPTQPAITLQDVDALRSTDLRQPLGPDNAAQRSNAGNLAAGLEHAVSSSPEFMRR